MANKIGALALNIAKPFSAGAVAVALVLGFSLPAYAEEAYTDPVAFQLQTKSPQQLQAESSGLIVKLGENIDPTKTPQVTAASLVNRNADAGEYTNRPGVVINLPAFAQGSAFVRAAQAQAGVGQDCTDLVQNSLAALGRTTRRDQGGYDEGPMTFAKYGTLVPASEARAGDIIARPGHVFIYTGDGVRHSGIHGGWQGSTVYVEGAWSDPHNYSMVIRLS